MTWDWKVIRDTRFAAAGSGAEGKLLHDSTYECVFCQGQGERPWGNICPVCRRSGLVSLRPPVVICAYCKGRGEVPPRSAITCLVCRGKGKVSVKEPIQICPNCRGRGRKIGASLYCIQCRGVGVISVKRGGRSSPVSVLPSEREVLETVTEAGGESGKGKTAIARTMGISPLYADQLCKELADKGLLKQRERGIYALTDTGKASVKKGASGLKKEMGDV